MYKEFNDAIGLNRTINEKVHIKDVVSHRDHQNNDVIMQKIYQDISGYHTDDNADDLKHDPALTTILGKEELSSQPTTSRVNQKLDRIR